MQNVIMKNLYRIQPNKGSQPTGSQAACGTTNCYTDTPLGCYKRKKMETIFSTKDFQEFREKEDILKDSEYEFSTKVNNSKYEILVDKNIFEEVKILLKLNNDNLKNTTNFNDENQKKIFYIM